MTAPLQFLRVLLGLLAVFFAHYLGRVATRQHLEGKPHTKTLTWFLRTTVCLLGVLWGHGLDLTSIVFLALVVASIAWGAWLELRPRRTDEEIHLFDNK